MTSSWPSAPPRSTGLTLLGAALKGAYTLRCRFDCQVRAAAAHDRRVACDALGERAAAGGAWYTYVRAWRVSYVRPSRVLSEGGTPLTVRGVGFASSSESAGCACRLGGAVRRGRVSAAVCATRRARRRASRASRWV